MTENTLENCTCASFFTVRGTHKKDCPAAPKENTLEKMIEAGLKEFDEKFPLPKILALSGGKGVERDQMRSFIRTLSLTIAQATHDAVSVEEKFIRENCEFVQITDQKLLEDNELARKINRRYLVSEANLKEMHERFTKIIGK